MEYSDYVREINSIIRQGPEKFREWLNTQPDDLVLDANSSCGCFLHNYLSDGIGATSNQEVKVFCTYVYISKYEGFIKLTEDGEEFPAWFEDFQDEVSTLEYQLPWGFVPEELTTGPLLCPVSIASAKEALEVVMLGAN